MILNKCQSSLKNEQPPWVCKETLRATKRKRKMTAEADDQDKQIARLAMIWLKIMRKKIAQLKNGIARPSISKFMNFVVLVITMVFFYRKHLSYEHVNISIYPVTTQIETCIQLHMYITLLRYRCSCTDKPFPIFKTKTLVWMYLVVENVNNLIDL